MSRPGSRPGAPEEPSAAVSAAAELLEVLRARGQDAPAPAVSPSQMRALLVVENAEGINLRTLGRVLGSRPPSVTRLCDRLEAIGLLTRSPSPSSRRELELRLTAGGRRLVAAQRGIRVREMAAVLERMEPAAVEALVQGLSAFQDAAAGLHAAVPASVRRTDASVEGGAAGSTGGAVQPCGAALPPVPAQVPARLSDSA
ncbi:MarR family winged helix-turn-helix transcriptional regulator [Streptomyces sp. cmx-4-9]|uniref:MarR family winged helix-turn-helix transcriptional regulator n=1 Tax=Streptomyces sp. cmx-4-9 TaxID=2790941 RepID=UPI00398086E2